MATTRLFLHQRTQRSVADIVVRRAILAVVAFHLIVGAISSYRAWVQVRRLDLRLDARVLRAGSIARAEVVSSGRVPVDVALELIQGAHSEIVGSVRVWKSGDSFYDPRPRNGSLAVALTSEQLGRFRSGPALVRATARGRSQWLRVPPPEVREFVVELVR